MTEQDEFRARYAPDENPDYPYQAQWYTGTPHTPDGYERGGWYATEDHAMKGAKRGKHNMEWLRQAAEDKSFTAHDDATSDGCIDCGNEWRSLNKDGRCSRCQMIWDS